MVHVRQIMYDSRVLSLRIFFPKHIEATELQISPRICCALLLLKSWQICTYFVRLGKSLSKVAQILTGWFCKYEVHRASGLDWVALARDRCLICGLPLSCLLIVWYVFLFSYLFRLFPTFLSCQASPVRPVAPCCAPSSPLALQHRAGWSVQWGHGGGGPRRRRPLLRSPVTALGFKVPNFQRK